MLFQHRAKEEAPPRAEPFFDKKTEKEIHAARQFQDDEVNRYKPIIPLLDTAQKALVEMYRGLPDDAEDADFVEKTNNILDAFIHDYTHWLIETMVEAGASAADASERALFLQGYESRHKETRESHTTDDGVGFGGRGRATTVGDDLTRRIAIDFDFHLVPEHVRGWAEGRANTLNSGGLSWRIWDTAKQSMYDTIRSSLIHGDSPQQFAQHMFPYLDEPGPTRNPSRIVANQRSLPYNAFRLARTEIMTAYNRGRIYVDDNLMQMGVIAGTRWILSRTHFARMGFDVCDVHADYADPNLGWLGDYGVATRGVYEPNSIPHEHVNGLCVTAPVATPRDLYRQALGGPGAVPTVQATRLTARRPPDGYPLVPPPPQWLGDTGDVTRAFEWFNEFGKMQGWTSQYNGNWRTVAGYPANASAGWDGLITFNRAHLDEVIVNFFASGGDPQFIRGFETLVHEWVHTVNVDRRPQSYISRSQQIFEEGMTTAYTQHLLKKLYPYLFNGIESNGAENTGTYSDSKEWVWLLANEATGRSFEEEDIIKTIDDWKKLTPSVDAWSRALDDVASGISVSLGRDLDTFEVRRLKSKLTGMIDDSSHGLAGWMSFNEMAAMKNALDNLRFEFERYPEWWLDGDYVRADGTYHPDSPAGFAYRPLDNLGRPRPGDSFSQR